MEKIIRKEDCWLLPIDELDLATTLTLDESILSALNKAAEWVTNYLCSSHPLLGRPGAVCPFVPKSLKSKQVWLSILSHQPIDKEVEIFANVFLDLDPIQSEEKIFILVMPNFIKERDMISLFSSIELLQKQYSSYGLSIAPFFRGNPATGLRSKDFRPGESSVPLIAIRKTTAHDLPFIMRNVEKEAPLKTYFSTFAPALPMKVREELVNILAHQVKDYE